MKYYNKTRKSKSIPKRLLKEGRVHLIPVYYLLLTSNLAKEGIINGGSYKFADHIYEGKAKGKYLFGTLLDWIFLRLKSSKSFRFRYISCKKEIMNLIESNRYNKKNLHILSVPSGYAREIFEIADELKSNNHKKYAYVNWHLLDLDKKLISEIKEKFNKNDHNLRYWSWDALNYKIFTKMGKFDLIMSTGFVDFLSDEQAVKFYRLIYKTLKSKGKFVTSGMKRHRLSDYLLRNIAELHTFYRTEEQLKNLASNAGFKSMRTYQEPNKILTMLVAEKG